MKTKFNYESGKCNLTTAENSDGQTVKLRVRPAGPHRTDRRSIAQAGENQIRDEVPGKPSIVTRPRFRHHVASDRQPDGEIQKSKVKKRPNVAVQVASIFNNLLDIIAPATSETPM